MQYRESDLAVATRLMERFGISYHFEHADGNHALIMTDAMTAHAPLPGTSRKFQITPENHRADDEHFWDMRATRRMKTGGISLTDYNFKMPNAAIEVDRIGDAAAFWGPSERFYVPKSGVPSVVTRPTLSGRARVATPFERPYAVNAQQMDVMGKITDQTFRARLADYLATEWAADVGDTQFQTLIGTVINDDCPRLEVCREMDIVMMAIARLRMPDLVASDEFWNAVIDQRPNPNQRAGAFLARLRVGMNAEEIHAFGRRVNGWWQFGK